MGAQVRPVGPPVPLLGLQTMTSAPGYTPGGLEETKLFSTGSCPDRVPGSMVAAGESKRPGNGTGCKGHNPLLRGMAPPLGGGGDPRDPCIIRCREICKEFAENCADNCGSLQ